MMELTQDEMEYIQKGPPNEHQITDSNNATLQKPSAQSVF